MAPLGLRGKLLVLAAVGELCTNSIRHASGDEPGQPIDVSVRWEDARVVIEVEDFGVAFDSTRYTPPDLGSLPEHGLGLYIARQAADDFSFDVARPRGTRWRLVKHVRPGGPDGERRPRP